MRTEQFLEKVKHYNIHNLREIMNNRRLTGGWEAWLQVELGMYFLAIEERDDICIEREALYQPGHLENGLKRCDFCIAYSKERDKTYIELKCQNLYVHNSLNDIFSRFHDDIMKQKQFSGADISGFCLAVVRCKCNEMISAVKTLYQSVGAVSSAFLLDWETRTIYNVAPDQPGLVSLKEDLRGTDVTFLLAVSPQYGGRE